MLFLDRGEVEGALVWSQGDRRMPNRILQICRLFAVMQIVCVDYAKQKE